MTNLFNQIKNNFLLKRWKEIKLLIKILIKNIKLQKETFKFLIQTSTKYYQMKRQKPKRLDMLLIWGKINEFINLQK